MTQRLTKLYLLRTIDDVIRKYLRGDGDMARKSAELTKKYQLRFMPEEFIDYEEFAKSLNEDLATYIRGSMKFRKESIEKDKE